MAWRRRLSERPWQCRNFSTAPKSLPTTPTYDPDDALLQGTMTTRDRIGTLKERGPWVLVAVLLLGDLLMVGLHIANTLEPVSNPLFDIEEDGGHAEVYQYLKLFSIVVLLIVISAKNRALSYLAWAAVFTYFLADDSLQVHERAGRALAAQLELVPAVGLRARDFGELAVSAAVGILLAAPLVWAYRSGSVKFKRVSQDVVLLILVLVFFGVAVDMAHVAIDLGWQFRFIMGIVEDGGELAAMSLILGYVCWTRTRHGAEGRYLGDFVIGALTKRST